MGSLATQGGGSGGGGSGGPTEQTIISSEDEAFVTSQTFVNALVVDLQTIKDSVFQIFNTSGATAIEYKVYASPKVQGGAPADADDSWRNILNGRLVNATTGFSDPSLYDHDLTITIPINGQQTESLDNAFAWARIEIRAITGTPSIKVWHRGTVP